MKSLLARWIFVSLGCMACISGIAGQSSPPATQATTQPGVGTLPEAWFGTWRGPAESVAPGGQIGGRYVMGLQIGASAEQAGATSPVYDWAITYEQGD